VLGELMNQIDGCEPTGQVLFVMNTNSLDRLEHAVKNRPRGLGSARCS
jgi:ATP-dependent 26S proteasome regulatory subunit